GEVNDPLDDADERRDCRPAKQQIDESLTDLAQVKLVRSKTAEEQRKERRSDTVVTGRHDRAERRVVHHRLADSPERTDLRTGVDRTPAGVAELDVRRRGRGHGISNRGVVMICTL